MEELTNWKMVCLFYGASAYCVGNFAVEQLKSKMYIRRHQVQCNFEKALEKSGVEVS